MYNFGVFFRRLTAGLLLCGMLALSINASPAVSAASAILINADTGEVIADYNADTRRGMASTTKIMTAIIAIEHGELDKKFTVPDGAIGVEGSSLYMKKGERMTMRELVTGLMLRSANDAAEAIAILIGGSVEGFADIMNRKADELGLENTHFTNPHGLSDENHYTTARELAKITAYALKNKTFCEICSSAKATLPGPDGMRYVVNHNKLLSSYDGAYGVKTGFTKATGRCLVSAAKREGVNLVAVTLNAPNDWSDHRAMLDYGFSLFESVSLAKKGTPVCTLPLIGGDKEGVMLYIKDAVSVCLRKERSSIAEHIELISPRFAPVYMGDEVGRIVYTLDGEIIAASPLCASEYVGAKVYKSSFTDKITRFFK